MANFDKKPSAEELALAAERPAGIVKDPRGPGLEAQTPAGEHVISRAAAPTPDITIDGMPMDEFTARKRAGKIPPDLREDESDIGQMFEESVALMFAPPQDEPTPPMSEAAASNIAFTDAIIAKDSSSYAERKEMALNGATVMDGMLPAMRDALVAQDAEPSGLLESSYFDSLDINGKMEALTTEAERVDHRLVTPRVHLLMLTFARSPEAPLSQFEEYAKGANITTTLKSMEYYTSIGRRRTEWDLLEVAAANGWTSPAAAIPEIIQSDFLPIVPLVARIKVLDLIAEKAGVDVKGWRGWAIGTYREELRKEIVKFTPDEFAAFTSGFKEFFDEKMQDPITAGLITKYVLIEQMEAVFTDDVFDGRSAIDKGDLWMGNFESLLEGVFSLLVVTKSAKGISRVATGAFGNVQARNAAAAVGAHKVAAGIDNMLQSDGLAIQFGHTADETATAMLPRPPLFAENLEELPDGHKITVVRSERVRDEILDSTDALTGSFLTQADRTNAVNKTIADIDLADGAYVHGRMSSLSMFENGTGYRMQVVVGDSAEGGYKNIQDAVSDAVQLDDAGDSVRIMRVDETGVLRPVFMDADEFARAATKGEFPEGTVSGIAGDADQSYYLVYDKDSFWHTADKGAFGPEAFQSGGLVPRVLLSPNAKFGDEIYGSFLRAYMKEQTILKNFEILFEPYYSLNKTDKQFVGAAYEWMEDFGKQHGRAVDIGEMMAKYDGITPAQIDGMIALRNGMDTMHELFNRKLYRDWQALGFKTARPLDESLPSFHGADLNREAAGRGGSMLDPITGKMVKMDARELDDLYNAGGRVMDLDIAIDAANDAGHRATRILLREDAYKVGGLSTKPMKYHPGYSMRFYDDPYYIVKQTNGIAVNGTVRAGASSMSDEAIRTAGTQLEADDFLRRISASEKDGSVTYRVVRANNLDNTESTLFQKQSIHREGRMFWDERSFDRLPDTNGNRALLEDPVTALERGIGQAARQLTFEDPLKAMKQAWKDDFGKLGFSDEVLDRFDLKEISDRMKTLALNETDSVLKTRIKQGRELIDYFRLMEGTESAVIPKLREATIGIATTIARMTGKGSRGVEKYAQTMDPTRTMRAAAFNAFMVFRPVRQALLQSSQIGYLAPLRPSYVASPQIFKDAFALRRGLKALRTSGYDDGFSVASMAKSMGITQKEYRVLLKQFDRSGIIDLVDVHSFAGGAGRFRKTALPANDSPLGTIGYKARQYGRGTKDWFQNVGFNFGERNNLTFTYNLALKQALDKHGYDSLLKMTQKNWDDLAVDASNLGLGMVRPNNFGYQTGITGVATQFFAFSHKAALGLLGANPAIKGTDAIKVLMGTYLLYGGNMYGSRDWAHDQLFAMGVSDREFGSTGVTLIDVLSAGMVENVWNSIGQMTIDDYKPLDFEWAAPGMNATKLWEMNLRTLMEQPTKAVFGPFGNWASGLMESADFVMKVHTGDQDISPAEKFTISAEMLLRGGLPIANDGFAAWQAYQLNQWYSSAGEPLALRPTMNALIARGLIGIRTREEISYYRMQNKLWENESDRRAIVKDMSSYMSRLVTALSDGTMERADVHRNIGAAVNFFEEWPEAIRLQTLKEIMEYQQNDSLASTVYAQLIASLADKKINTMDLLPQIDDFTDIPVEKREQLKNLITEANEGRKKADAKALESLEEAR